MANLLLHSLKEFDEIIFEITEQLAPETILEIGSETGVVTEWLLAYCARSGAELHTVEPDPTPELFDKANNSDLFYLYPGFSVPFLEEYGCKSELVLVDGDHNYWTVSNELRLIGAGWDANDISGAILLHDVGFPCGRRDCYYNPATIPPDAIHPHSFEYGVTLDSTNLIKGGFRGEGAFAWALHEGGGQNGVLCAVEDFVASNPSYELHKIDAVFGLGALTRAGSKASDIVSSIFSRYDNKLVSRLERNRLELYLRVLELQDLLSQRQRNQ